MTIDCLDPETGCWEALALLQTDRGKRSCVHTCVHEAVSVGVCVCVCACVCVCVSCLLMLRFNCVSRWQPYSTEAFASIHNEPTV